MKKVNFNDYEKLAEYIHSNAADGSIVVTALFYDDAAALMRELLRFDDVEVGGIDIAPADFSGYSKEYYVSLADDMVLDVEPAHNGKCYLYTGADLMLIHGDANSSIVRGISDDDCREIYIGADKDNDKKVFATLDDISDDIVDLFLDNAKFKAGEDGESLKMTVDIGSILDTFIKTFFD